MAYIGNNLTVQQYAPTIVSFTGNGSTTSFTLPIAVVTSAQIIVTVNNVVQNPTYAYSVNGTTLTFTSAPPANSTTPVNIWVEYTSLQTNLIAPSTGTVTTNSLSPGFILPIANGGTGSNSFGSTGSGVIVLQSSPTINTPSLTTPTISSGSILNSNGRPMAAQTGGILQVIQAITTSTFSSTSTGSWVSTGFSASITPSSTSSKILVTIQLSTGQSTAGWSTNWGMQRNGTQFGGGVSTSGAPAYFWIATDAYSSDNEIYGLSQSYIDSPATTSAVTYLLTYYGEGNTGYLNRNQSLGSGVNNATGISTITLMEIAQ
jgi:hypothetical protein